MPQSFAKVALTPKWIGALFLALAVAAVFALLGQWQLGRALTTVGNKHAAQPAVTLETLTKPGSGFKTKDTARKVTIEVNAAEFLGRVANRKQDDKTGTWHVGLATLSNGDKLVIAYDFSTESDFFAFAPTGKLAGYYLPSEEPQNLKGDLFQSLSVEQLINQTDKQIGTVYPGFVAIADAQVANPIVIQNQDEKTEINVLNAFYAIEWALFAGFAVFLWWRLVQDERLGLRAER